MAESTGEGRDKLPQESAEMESLHSSSVFHVVEERSLQQPIPSSSTFHEFSEVELEVCTQIKVEVSTAEKEDESDHSSVLDVDGSSETDQKLNPKSGIKMLKRKRKIKADDETNKTKKCQSVETYTSDEAVRRRTIEANYWISAASQSENSLEKYRGRFISSKVPFLASPIDSLHNLSREPDISHLSGMNQILFLDLDNCVHLFPNMLSKVPKLTFTWCFYGGKWIFKEPINNPVYDQAKQSNMVFINPRAGPEKDASDFSIVYQVSRLDLLLPMHVGFIILSGDNGYQQITRQFEEKERQISIVDPHHQSPEEVYDVLKLISNNGGCWL